VSGDDGLAAAPAEWEADHAAAVGCGKATAGWESAPGRRRRWVGEGRQGQAEAVERVPDDSRVPRICA